MVTQNQATSRTSSRNAVRNSVLLRDWNTPENVCSYSSADWELFLSQARACRLAGQWAYKLAQLENFDKIPEPAQQALDAAWTAAEHHRRTLLWQIHQVSDVLQPLACPKILLKGAAYIAMDLEFAQGRLVSDMDMLVPKAFIIDAERKMLDAGWVSGKYEPYDQRYYRQWMHEIPPLFNPRRCTTLDMHHNILPETSRRSITVEPIIAAALPLRDKYTDGSSVSTGSSVSKKGKSAQKNQKNNGVIASTDLINPSRWCVFQDVDMVIHAAVHLFQEGEISGSVRDIIDLDGLIRYHSQQTPDFWDRLFDRARQFKLDRPLYYAVYFSHEILDTPIADTGMKALRSIRPNVLTRQIMDRLVLSVLTPPQFRPSRWTVSFGRLVLYARSHYGRMPLNLLIPHLWHKTFPKDPLPVIDNDGQAMN